MIYHEREKRLALHSARHATLESEAEKSDSGNGSGESSKKQSIFACFLQQFLVVNKIFSLTQQEIPLHIYVC